MFFIIIIIFLLFVFILNGCAWGGAYNNSDSLHNCTEPTGARERERERGEGGKSKEQSCSPGLVGDFPKEGALGTPFLRGTALPRTPLRFGLLGDAEMPSVPRLSPCSGDGPCGGVLWDPTSPLPRLTGGGRSAGRSGERRTAVGLTSLFAHRVVSPPAAPVWGLGNVPSGDLRCGTAINARV